MKIIIDGEGNYTIFDINNGSIYTYAPNPFINPNITYPDKFIDLRLSSMSKEIKKKIITIFGIIH